MLIPYYIISSIIFQNTFLKDKNSTCKHNHILYPPKSTLLFEVIFACKELITCSSPNSNVVVGGGAVSTSIISNSWIPTGCPTIQLWHYLLGDSIISHRSRVQSYKTAPCLPQTPVTSPGYHLYFWPTDYKSELPKIPFLGLVNLLQWLMELRETFCLLDHQLIIRGYNLGTARWKRCTGQCMGKGHGTSKPSLSTPLSPDLHIFTNPEAFWICPFGFLWRLHYTGMTD